MSRRFKGAGLGEELVVGAKEKYRVVGIFTAGGGAAESEVWVDRKELEQNTARGGSVSSVQLRAASPAAFEEIRKTLEDDTQFKLAAIPEAKYFAEQSQSSMFLKVAGTLIAIFLTIGAMFAAANTMYAAVRSRTREIGTMRALGFSRFDLLISFLGESHPPLLARRNRRPARDAAAERPDLRHEQLQHVRRGHDQLPLRPDRDGRRLRHDDGHGRLRRTLPRAPCREDGRHLGASGGLIGGLPREGGGF